MASDVECITLDDSDEEDKFSSVSGISGVAGPSGGHRSGAGSRRSMMTPVLREEQMMRCNLCVDPGLLPVEEDRASHRSVNVFCSCVLP